MKELLDTRAVPIGDEEQLALKVECPQPLVCVRISVKGGKNGKSMKLLRCGRRTALLRPS